MAGQSTMLHTGDVSSGTLLKLYSSVQQHMRYIMERSLDLGRTSLSGLLDDVLIRQRFWEHDIHLEDGALSNLEANDAVASSIIRRYLETIRLCLEKIDLSLSDNNTSSQESELSTNNDEENISLLCDTNTRLCDKVEIFDAIACAGNEPRATAISNLRLQMELENQKLEASNGKKPDTSLVLLYAPEMVQHQTLVDIIAVKRVNLYQGVFSSNDFGSWLRDNLLQITPEARVFCYDYYTPLEFEFSRALFVHGVTDLLESVKVKRGEDGSKRPLIFIAHGLDVMLVEQALVYAHQSSTYISIYASLAGLVFFNRPSRRDLSGLHKLGRLAGSIAQPSYLPPHSGTEKMEDLLLGSPICLINPSQGYPGFWERSGQLDTVRVGVSSSELRDFLLSEQNSMIAASKIEHMYLEALRKAKLSQPERAFGAMSFGESPSQELGSTSSAKTHKFKKSDPEHQSDQDVGSSSSAQGKSA